MAQEFTDDNFESAVLQSEIPVLVDFGAPWCVPCRMLAPVIDELATELEGKVLVGTMETDANQKTAAKYQIQAIPALVVFKGGEVVNRWTGPLPKEKILELIEPAFAEGAPEASPAEGSSPDPAPAEGSSSDPAPADSSTPAGVPGSFLDRNPVPAPAADPTPTPNTDPAPNSDPQ